MDLKTLLFYYFNLFLFVTIVNFVGGPLEKQPVLKGHDPKMLEKEMKCKMKAGQNR